MEINLANNELSGTIPTEYGLLSSLQNLNLSGNRALGGSIPTELGDLSALLSLNLTKTALTGDVTIGLCLLRPCLTSLSVPPEVVCPCCAGGSGQPL